MATEADRLLLVLDGLDELALADTSGSRDAQGRTVAERLAFEAHDLHGESIAVIITSRHLTASHVWRYLEGYERFEILRYFFPRRPGANYREPSILANQEDYRSVWWHKFGVALGRGFEGVPPVFDKLALEELTTEPLTNLLVALSWLTADKPEALKSSNDVYAQIIEVVRRREYETGRKRRFAVEYDALDSVTFESLLHDVATAAWPNGGRAVHIASIERHSRASGNEALFQKFIAPARNRLPSALLLSYFRENDDRLFRHGQIEFTHKSLCDFLISRRLVKLLRQWSGSNAIGKVGFDEARVWLGLADLSEPHIQFMHNELAALELQEIKGIHNWAIEILEYFQKAGFAIIANTGKTLSGSEDLFDAQALLTNATRALRHIWIVANLTNREAISRSKNKPDGAIPLMKVSPAVLEGILRKPHWTDLVRSHMKGLSAERESFVGLEWSSALVDESRFEDCDMFGMFGQRAVWDDSVLKRCHFDHAILQEASFESCQIESCGFESADLEHVQFNGSTIVECDFSLSRLSSAVFEGATLVNCCFRGSDLRGCVLAGVTLDAATDFADAYALPDIVNSALVVDGAESSLAALGWALVHDRLQRVKG